MLARLKVWVSCLAPHPIEVTIFCVKSKNHDGQHADGQGNNW